MKLGELLVSKIKIDINIINNALEEQKEYLKKGINKKLGEILIEKKVITQSILSQALEFQNKKRVSSNDNKKEVKIEPQNKVVEKEVMGDKQVSQQEKKEIKHTIDNKIEVIQKDRSNFVGKPIKEILNGYFEIENSIIDEALFKQKKVFKDKKKLGEILIEDGLVGVDTIYAALAMQRDIEYISYGLIKSRIDYKIYKNENIYKYFDKDDYVTLLYTIMKAKALPLFWDIENDEDCLTIGITEPDNIDAKIMIDSFKNKNVKVKVLMTSKKLYSDFILKYKELTLEELEEFSNQIDRITPETFLQYLLVYSILHEVSDIHLAPSSNNSARVAVRILGTIETLFYLTLDNYNKLIAVVKNNAEMKADKTRSPQDGRIDGKKLLKDVKIKVNRRNVKENSYDINENLLEYNFENVSFRISTYPTEPPYELQVGQTFEKCVIRVLNLSSGLVSLKELGLSSQVAEELEYGKSRNQGIIFIVGPTGSGKSTTLYSALSSINSIEKNIITFEDPVEMRQLYWAQGQRNVVDDNKDVNFNYLEARKSILRQDPDIILMGEVRDEESASFAVESANTGHLVFTTLHSNSAAATFERVKKLGVKELELASSVISVLSQRLVKKVCPHCSTRRNISEKEKKTFLRMELDESKIPKTIVEHKKDGCKYCNFKGYVGRKTISEIIPATSEIKKAIVEGASELEIRKIASKLNYRTILEDGILAMDRGEISIHNLFEVS